VPRGERRARHELLEKRGRHAVHQRRPRGMERCASRDAPLRCPWPAARVLGGRRGLCTVRTRRHECPASERRTIVIRSLLALAAALSILCCLAPAALADDPSPLALGSAAPMRETMLQGADGRERSIASVA